MRVPVLLLAAALLAGCGGSDRAATPPAAPSPSASSPPGPSAGRPSLPQPSLALRLTGSWTTYGGDATRSSAVPGGPDPVQPTVAWRARLDGAVYASPLVVRGAVLAATENGSLYALDGRTGRVLWRRHLADPVPGDALPCGNIDPLGITGTPVVDPAGGLVLAVATERGPRHVLYGVDVRTGAVRLRRVVDVPGMEPATHLQRAALLLSGRTVYVAYGGNYGDCGQYRGRVVAVPLQGGPLRSFVVPTRREAGIWAAAGPALLPGGDVLVSTGNGEARGGAWDRSDSVLRLSPDLVLRDGFAPRRWAEENSVDADLGSMGPLVLPGARYAVTAGKGGSTYLLDLQRLGGVGGEVAALAGCRAFGGGAAVAGTVFLPCAQGLTQVLVRDGRLVRGWRAADDVVGSPLLVGSTVWSVQQDGTLVGLAAGDGTVRARLQVGRATRFAKPATSGNALLVPTKDGVTAVRIAYS